MATSEIQRKIQAMESYFTILSKTAAAHVAFQKTLQNFPERRPYRVALGRGVS